MVAEGRFTGQVVVERQMFVHFLFEVFIKISMGIIKPKSRRVSYTHYVVTKKDVRIPKLSKFI